MGKQKGKKKIRKVSKHYETTLLSILTRAVN